MEYKDYYRIMGLSRDASADEIKRAYRKLARKYHPDVSKEADAERHFKELGEAYEVLKDPNKRAAYDRLGTDWRAGEEFRPPPDWRPESGFGGGGVDSGAFEAGFGADFSDFFNSLFGGGFTRRGSSGRGFQAHGEDSHARITIDLAEAYSGGNHVLTLQQTELGADGRPRLAQRSLNVRIPKGIAEGQHIRLKHQGGAGLGGGEAGDLYLEIHYQPHHLFRVEGRDVYYDLPVAPWEAALGAVVQAPTPTGPVALNIPAGSADGARLRLKRRGIPGSPPGDLYAVLRIALPPADSEAVREAYRVLQRSTRFEPRADLRG